MYVRYTTLSICCVHSQWLICYREYAAIWLKPKSGFLYYAYTFKFFFFIFVERYSLRLSEKSEISGICFVGYCLPTVIFSKFSAVKRLMLRTLFKSLYILLFFKSILLSKPSQTYVFHSYYAFLAVCLIVTSDDLWGSAPDGHCEGMSSYC